MSKRNGRKNQDQDSQRSQVDTKKDSSASQKKDESKQTEPSVKPSIELGFEQLMGSPSQTEGERQKNSEKVELSNLPVIEHTVATNLLPANENTILKRTQFLPLKSSFLEENSLKDDKGKAPVINNDKSPDSVGIEQESPKTHESFETMEELLKSEGTSVDNYLALESNKPRLHQNINKFNQMLKDLSSKEIYKKPFTVTINVGNLKGYGDITAGAKLAKELKEFLSKFEEWKEVTVKLYLSKVKELQESQPEFATIRDMVTHLIGNATVNLINFQEELEDEDINRPKVNIGYPVSPGQQDIDVVQYGHKQLESKFPLGSGPGFGALGVLSTDPKTQQEAIERAKNPNDSKNLTKLGELCNEHNIQKTHFAYFSIYDKRPKDFAIKICNKELDKNTVVVYAKSGDSLQSIGDGIRDVRQKSGLPIVKIIKISVEQGIAKTQEDKKQDNADELPKEHKKQKKSGKLSKKHKKQNNSSKLRKEDEKQDNVDELPKTVLLVDFPKGVTNGEMLSLYYKSDAPVGATGDQSFMEAYAMRRKKNEDSDRDSMNDKEPDIYYDVAEHQMELHKQLLELKERKYKNGFTQGLAEINIHDNISEALDKKLLLYPILMLINQAVLEVV